MTLFGRRAAGAPFVCLVLVAGMAVSADPALAGWSHPRSLEERGWDAYGARVATGHGWTTVVWGSVSQATTRYVVRLRQVRPNGSLTSARTISGDSTAGEPAVAADGRGRALAAWAEGDGGTSGDVGRIYVRRIRHGARLGKPLLVSRLPSDGIGDGDPAIAIAPGGKALISWTDVRSGDVAKIQWRTLSRAGRLGRVHTARNASGDPAVTACADGSFVVGSVSDRQDLVLQRVTHRGVIERDVTRHLERQVWQAAVACDGSSGAHVALIAARDLSAGRGLAAYVCVWRRSGRVGRTMRVSTKKQWPARIAIATDRAGTSEVAWAYGVGGLNYRLASRLWSRAGSLGSVHRYGSARDILLAPGTDEAPSIALAVDPVGHGVLAWTHAVDQRYGPQEIRATALSRTGRPRRVTTFSGNSVLPAVATTRTGQAILVRERYESRGRILLQTGP